MRPAVAASHPLWSREVEGTAELLFRNSDWRLARLTVDGWTPLSAEDAEHVLEPAQPGRAVRSLRSRAFLDEQAGLHYECFHEHAELPGGVFSTSTMRGLRNHLRSRNHRKAAANNLPAWARWILFAAAALAAIMGSGGSQDR
ncbi:hypothetical protein OC834_003872 [Tilletia horrida]|nr:hypothetical protein OC834_003872 [Tilletia horrida]